MAVPMLRRLLLATLILTGGLASLGAGEAVTPGSAATPTTKPTTHPDRAPAITLDPKDKAAVDAAVDKQVVIRGTVTAAEWSRTGKVMRIRFKGNEESKLLAVAFTKLKDDLDKKFGGNAAEQLVGKLVCVTGKLVVYQSKDGSLPEVVIEKVEQIELVEMK